MMKQKHANAQSRLINLISKIRPIYKMTVLCVPLAFPVTQVTRMSQHLRNLTLIDCRPPPQTAFGAFQAAFMDHSSDLC